MADSDLQKSGDRWPDQENKSGHEIILKLSECRYRPTDENRPCDQDESYEDSYWARALGVIPPPVENTTISSDVLPQVAVPARHGDEFGSTTFMAESMSSMGTTEAELRPDIKSETLMRIKRNAAFRRPRPKLSPITCTLAAESPSISPILDTVNTIEWREHPSSPEWSSLKSLSLTDSPTLGSDEERYMTVRGIRMNLPKPVENNHTYTINSYSDTDGNKSGDEEKEFATKKLIVEHPQFFFDEDGNLSMPGIEVRLPQSTEHMVISSSIYEDAKSMALSSAGYEDATNGLSSSYNDIINDYLGTSSITTERYCNVDEEIRPSGLDGEDSRHKIVRTNLGRSNSGIGIDLEHESNNIQYNRLRDSSSEGVSGDSENELTWSDYGRVNRDYCTWKSVASNLPITSSRLPIVNDDESSASSISKNDDESLKVNSSDLVSESKDTEIVQKKKKKNKFVKFFQDVRKHLRKKK